MGKFLNLGRVKMGADDYGGGPGGTSTQPPVARPTGMPLPAQYASAAQMASTQQFMPVQQMQPIDQPSPPTQPPSTTPDVPDPGLTCPAGTIFDAATNRCIPQYPIPQPPQTQTVIDPQTGAPVVVPVAPPPGYYSLFGRLYPMWTLYLAGGALGFGALLLVFLAGRRRGRRLSAA